LVLTRRGHDLQQAEPVTAVREAMVSDPPTLPVDASAQEAGQALARPEVRAVFVCDGDRFVGVLTRKTLVREVVATGRDPTATTVGDIAEEPLYTVAAETPVDEAFQFMELEDIERVPVVEGERLVGVLSRSGLQRRLAEDEPPAPDPDLVA
jgi:CBS domain-containing protein